MMMSLRSKWAVSKARGGRISQSIRNRRVTQAAGPFSTEPSGPRPVGCFSALLARPVWIQIWAHRSRLEKQPTDLRRHHHYMRDGTLVYRPRNSRDRLSLDFKILKRES